MRSEGNLTSPSKRICPTPTWNGFGLARCFARGTPRQPIPASALSTSTPVASRGLPAPARDIHRACEYALYLPVIALGLLGVLLEGSLGNRNRQPTPAFAIQNRPTTGLHPSSDCSSARFNALFMSVVNPWQMYLFYIRYYLLY